MTSEMLGVPGKGAGCPAVACKNVLVISAQNVIEVCRSRSKAKIYINRSPEWSCQPLWPSTRP